MSLMHAWCSLVVSSFSHGYCDSESVKLSFFLCSSAFYPTAKNQLLYLIITWTGYSRSTSGADNRGCLSVCYNFLMLVIGSWNHFRWNCIVWYKRIKTYNKKLKHSWHMSSSTKSIQQTPSVHHFSIFWSIKPQSWFLCITIHSNTDVVDTQTHFTVAAAV